MAGRGIKVYCLYMSRLTLVRSYIKDKGPLNHETGNDRMCAACIVINACGVRLVIESVLSLYVKTNSC
jgi:hypothetical protein